MTNQNESINNNNNNNSYITSLNVLFPKRRTKPFSTLISSSTKSPSLHIHNNKSSSTPNIHPLDGFAIKSHHMSIADLLNQSINSFNNQNTNLILNQPFPLINIISKRNILNNSSSLIKNILRYKRNQYQSRDQHLLLSKHIPKQINLPEGYAINSKRTKRTNESLLSDKDEINKKSLSYLLDMEKKSKCKIKTYLHSHDCNVFNRTYFKQDPFDNYVKNAYKVKSFYKENIFISRIKNDVCRLKYSNSLKAYPDL